MLALILNTMNANSFNFIIPDLPNSEYTIAVQAKLWYEQTDGEQYEGDGVLPTNAFLGNGSVTMETVRMVKDEDVELE